MRSCEKNPDEIEKERRGGRKNEAPARLYPRFPFYRKIERPTGRWNLREGKNAGEKTKDEKETAQPMLIDL